MRIAIDGRALTGRYTGDRTYWQGLLNGLLAVDTVNEYLIFTRLPLTEDAQQKAPNVTYQTVAASNERFWTLFALPKALKQAKADVVHVQYTIPLPWLTPCAIVTTVHDISFKLFPQWFTSKDRFLLNLTVRYALSKADAVITDSESSKQDMLRAYGNSAERVQPIPLGLPEGFGQQAITPEQFQATCKRYDLHKPFVLVLGVLQPRKNLRMLAEAFGQAKSRYSLPHELVFVGKAGWLEEREELLKAAVRGGGEHLRDAIRFTGYVEDAEVPILYRACTLFAHPALYEGFGFTPLEAMACGVPTVVSDAPAMPENVGDAAMVVPASDIEAWTTALGTLLQDEALRRAYGQKGLAQAARFDWQQTAKQTLAVYQQVVEKRQRK